MRQMGYERASQHNKKMLWRLAGSETRHIQDIERWFTYQKYRNKTSHEYNEEFVISDDFIETIREFHEDSQVLLENLKNIN